MATVNISRSEGRHKKRDVSVCACKIGIDEMTTSADVYQLAQMPKNVLITDATIVVMTANDAATSCTVDIGWAGGAELFNNIDVTTAAGTETQSVLLPLLHHL